MLFRIGDVEVEMVTWYGDKLVSANPAPKMPEVVPGWVEELLSSGGLDGTTARVVDTDLVVNEAGRPEQIALRGDRVVYFPLQRKVMVFQRDVFQTISSPVLSTAPRAAA